MEKSIFKQIKTLVHERERDKGIFKVAFDIDNNKKQRKYRAIVWKSTPHMWEKRLRIVFDNCSIFATVGHMNERRDEQTFNHNKLNNVATRLGLSKYGVKNNARVEINGHGQWQHLPASGDKDVDVLSLWKNLSSLKKCNTCHRSNKRLRRCKKCKQLYFCSKLCQKRDWQRNYVHKYYCSIVSNE